MDLNKLLKKTEKRSEKITSTREAPKVASEERPYTVDLEKKTTTKPQVPADFKSEQTNPRTELKRSSNSTQTVNTMELKESSNGTHSELKRSSNSTQTVNTMELKESSQTELKRSSNFDFEKLRGRELRFLQFVFNECLSHGDLMTPPITSERMSLELKIERNSLKTVIARVYKKNLVIRSKSATGRGGYSRFELPKHVYQAFLIKSHSSNWSSNGTQTELKQGSEWSSQRSSIGPSSSSDLKNKTTTTEEPEYKLSEAWREIDFTLLKPFGFSENHLVQLARQNLLTPQIVQDSIHAFVFDLEKNQKGKGLNSSPVNFFMGILRKGLPYAAPANYESPEDKAMREYRGALETRAKKRAEEEKRIQTLEFAEWRRGVTLDWIQKNLSDLAWTPGPAQEGSLKSHFEKNVWPSIKAHFEIRPV